MKLTVGKKLSFIISILVILILVIGVLINYNLSESNEKMNWLYENQLKGVEYIKNAEINIISLARARNNLILSTKQEEQADHIKNIESHSDDFEKNIALFEKTLSLESAKKLTSEVVELWQDVKQREQEIVNMVQSGIESETIYIKVAENRKLVREMETKISELVEIKNGLALGAIDESNSSYIRSRNISISILLLCMAVGVVSAIYINNTIAKPIVRISNATRKIANGDLSGELIYVKSKDEIGELANSFNQMTGNLRNIIGNVTNASARVASSSEELFASAQQMTSATEEISTTINELAMGASQQAEDASNNSVVVNQMVSTIERIAENADNVSEAGLNASKEVENGISQSKIAVKNIELIKSIVDDSANGVKKLGEQSIKIGEIVEVIKGISDQTNLLALNAAIEAARAGDQGKGFAVVAEEVRKLAEESSGSAMEIEKIVSNIQAETSSVVDIMDSAIKEVASGVAAVNGTEISFDSIFEEVGKVSEQVNHLTSEIQEILEGNRLLGESIESMASISQETAASTEEISASSEEQTASMEEISQASQEFASLAESLQLDVAKFRL